MRIICDAPGQTCNRLWTYVASVAECVAERKRMMILFFDWTIEDFPALLHAPFVWYPLYHPWFLRLKKGWGWYKHLTWKVTHNRVWDGVFRFLGCTKGWQTRTDTRYLQPMMPELQRIFRPKDDIVRRAEAMVAGLRQTSDVVVGVHIRRGDYATWQDGQFFYELEDYRQLMVRVQQLYAGRRVSFFISSNEDFSLSSLTSHLSPLTSPFSPLTVRRFDGNEPSGAILDLYTLSLCDRLMGPPSTFSRWASFIGRVPLCFIEKKEQAMTEQSFSVITDFFHFADGRTIPDW